MKFTGFKLASEYVMLGVTLAALFKVSFVLGTLMVVSLAAYEIADYFERKEIIKEIEAARNILLQLDNVVEETPPKNNVGNC